MPTLTWHPAALGDVARLYDFLASNNPSAARRGVKAIRSAANQLLNNPRLGTPYAEFREWPAKFGRRAYVLRYLVLDNGDVLIVRVWHSRELRPR
ncbi:MAG TPA: type II toxin-antitoxin system RelE/ParE family toxin [Burkholderiaceae bacterium]|nr:type II toxin-antitoxin system RelE/ParE family toxin [Burkholderiaceae bacterium]